MIKSIMKNQKNSETMVWFNNRIVSASDALVKANSSAARFGLSVFEGVRGYFNSNSKKILLFRLEDHLERLFKSAQGIGFSISMNKSQIRDAIAETIFANECKNDIYLRIDAVAAESESWNSTEPAIIHITLNKLFNTHSIEQKAAKACISEWIRIDESQMPPSIKAGANYINSRYAYLDAKKLGFDFPIFPNLSGNIAESSGASVMCFKDGVLLTPPLSAQVLDSITRDSILKIAADLMLPFKVIDIKKEALKNSQEVFLCGTSAEIIPILSIDNDQIGNGQVGSVTKFLYEKYIEIARGNNEIYKKWIFELNTLR
jgi:branched-chain amino acid aminotransferase